MPRMTLTRRMIPSLKRTGGKRRFTVSELLTIEFQLMTSIPVLPSEPVISMELYRTSGSGFVSEHIAGVNALIVRDP